MSFKVKDFMEISFPVTSFETPILEAAYMIADGVHDLIVVMERGIPKGFVSATDIVTKVIASGLDPAKIRVMDVMTTSCSTISPDDDMIHASEIIRGGANLLLVVKNNIFYGVITPNTLALRFGEYADKIVKDVTRNFSMLR
ncbi:MAG: CBS domain-containing protein [Candidatus Bathyarchaeia archaeon]|jgi:CBS domain-containing protein